MSEWSCIACTLLNNSAYSTCKLCGTERCEHLLVADSSENSSKQPTGRSKRHAADEPPKSRQAKRKEEKPATVPKSKLRTEASDDSDDQPILRKAKVERSSTVTSDAAKTKPVTLDISINSKEPELLPASSSSLPPPPASSSSCSSCCSCSSSSSSSSSPPATSSSSSSSSSASSSSSSSSSPTAVAAAAVAGAAVAAAASSCSSSSSSSTTSTSVSASAPAPPSFSSLGSASAAAPSSSSNFLSANAHSSKLAVPTAGRLSRKASQSRSRSPQQKSKPKSTQANTAPIDQAFRKAYHCDAMVPKLENVEVHPPPTAAPPAASSHSVSQAMTTQNLEAPKQNAKAEPQKQIAKVQQHKLAPPSVPVLEEKLDDIRYNPIELSAADAESGWIRPRTSKLQLFPPFMVIDVTSDVDGSFHVYGVTAEGVTTRLNVIGFSPYIYIAIKKTDDVNQAEELTKALNTHLGHHLKKGKPPVPPESPTKPSRPHVAPAAPMKDLDDEDEEKTEGGVPQEEEEDEDDDEVVHHQIDEGVNLVVKIEIVERTPLLYFRKNQKGWYAKIYLRQHSLCQQVASVLYHQHLEGRLTLLPTLFVGDDDVYEANVNNVLRFMVDCGIAGGGWLALASPLSVSASSTSPVELEATVHWKAAMFDMSRDALESVQVAALRVLSFDIQSSCLEDRPPDAEIDSIQAISCALTFTQGGVVPWRVSPEAVHVVFQLRPSASSTIHYSQQFPLDSHPIFFYVEAPTETQLLLQFKNFLMQSDPDVITGYEVGTFDFPFFLERAKRLKILDQINCLGRNPMTKVKVAKVQTYSAAWVVSRRRMGQTSNELSSKVTIEGRLFIDMKRIVQTGHKLSTYSLQEACDEFLGSPQELLTPKTINRLGNSSRALLYMLKQAVLPLRVLGRLATLVDTTELARACGITLADVFTKGMMIRTWSLLLRRCRETDYIVPSSSTTANSGQLIEGPLVIDPISLGTTGLHKAPVVVVDFASMYPSVMIAYNICFSTLLIPADENKLVPTSDCHVTPINRHFVKSSVREGILPGILRYLLDARTKVKHALQRATSDAEIQVLNSRQQAFKTSSNALYGFTGAPTSKLFEVALAESTLGYGKRLLSRAATFVRDTYPDATTLYGNTDSLMVECPASMSHKQAVVFGNAMSAQITALFPEPISLKFEKVFCPFLLQQTNKYAGYIRSESPPRLEIKGMESVRRDALPFLRTLMENVLDDILVKDDLLGSMERVKRELKRLLKGDVSMGDMLMTKALWRDGQYSVRNAHTQLAEKLRERGSTVVLGQRLTYVFVQGEKAAKQHELSEDPLFALKNQLPLNLRLYADSLIEKPLVRVFCLKGLLGSTEKAQALFAESHRVVAKQQVSTRQGIGMFFKVNPKVEKKEEIGPDASQSALTSQCQTCQGHKGPIYCMNQTCLIFWKRHATGTGGNSDLLDW